MAVEATLRTGKVDLAQIQKGVTIPWSGSWSWSVQEIVSPGMMLAALGVAGIGVVVLDATSIIPVLLPSPAKVMHVAHTEAAFLFFNNLAGAGQLAGAGTAKGLAVLAGNNTSFLLGSQSTC